MTKSSKTDFKYILFFITIIVGAFGILITVSFLLYSYVLKDFDLYTFLENQTETTQDDDVEDFIVPKDYNNNIVIVNKKVVESTATTVLNTTPANVTKTYSKPKVTVPTPTCYEYKLGEPFNKARCYLAKDYDAISIAYSRYRTADSNVDFYKYSIGITCNGSDFFADACKDDKKSLEKAEQDKDKYESKILSIIPRGK